MNTRTLDSSAFQPRQRMFAAASGLTSIGLGHNIFTRTAYVRVSVPNSPWFENLQEKFNDICSLPVGWDGYAGFPVSFNNAIFAANLLERLYLDGVPAPAIVPGSDGSLQLEWHRNQFDVEIDVLAPYEVLATRTDHANNTEQEFELESDFSVLADWISDLKSIDNEIDQFAA